MKHIDKIKQPQSLVEHRSNKPSYYHNLPPAAMNDLRENLLSEQGHICCYCMKRIPEMKIEHFLCQSKHDDKQLVYANLLGACNGNMGQPKKLETCDTKKGDIDLKISPTSTAPNCETIIKYTRDGEIFTDDEAINKQLDEVLNLNLPALKEYRKAVYLQVEKEVEVEGKRQTDKKLKLRFLEQKRDEWLSRSQNKHKEYCMVAVYYLNKKIRANHQ